MRADEAQAAMDRLDAAIADIEERIKQIEADDRYPDDPEDNAQVQINAPLALIQQDLQGEHRGLHKALKALQDHDLY